MYEVKSVEEMKKGIEEEAQLDNVLASMEALTQVIEENGPQYMHCVDRVLKVFMPSVIKSMEDGFDKKIELIIKGTKVLMENGFTREQAVELLKR